MGSPSAYVLLLLMNKEAVLICDSVKQSWAGMTELNAGRKKAELRIIHVASARDRHAGILLVNHSHIARHR